MPQLQLLCNYLFGQRFLPWDFSTHLIWFPKTLHEESWFPMTLTEELVYLGHSILTHSYSNPTLASLGWSSQAISHGTLVERPLLLISFSLGWKGLNPTFIPWGLTRTDDYQGPSGDGGTGWKPQGYCQVTRRVGSVWYLAQFGAFAPTLPPTAPHAWSKAHWSLKRPVLVKGLEI